MNNILKINENLYRLTVPYADIYTTVYVVKTDKGTLLFDAASYDEDIRDYILPFLNELEITTDMLKYVCISHNHKDHSGGLSELMKSFSNSKIISRCPNLKQKYADYTILVPEDGDTVLDVLKIITIPGHTQDSIGIYDTRSKTLISGDSLQLFGIFGSGKWGSNIGYPAKHIDAVHKLKNMDIRHILTAHDYHPYGYSYEGTDNVARALDACIEPLNKIKTLIDQNPNFDDDQICDIYNSADLPTLGSHVVTAVREEL